MVKFLQGKKTALVAFHLSLLTEEAEYLQKELNQFGVGLAEFEVLIGHVDYFDRKTWLEMFRENVAGADILWMNI